MTRYGMVGLLMFFCTVTAIAQDQSVAYQALPAASQLMVVSENDWTSYETIDISDGRIDKQLGILRAAYNLNPDIVPDATPEATARKWLEVDGHKFGIHLTETLELVRETETVGASHLTFQQTLSGVRVFGSYMHVNIGRSGLPVMATSTYMPHIEQVDTFQPIPAIHASQAEIIAQQAVSDQSASSMPAELFVLPNQSPRLIWKVIAWPDSIAAEWEVLIDANTGALIQLMDQRIFLRSDPKSKAEGQGRIWLYDPLTASGESYGGAFTDNNDRDNSALSNQLIDVTLHDITQDSNNMYRLSGPRVRIAGSNPPAERDPNQFKYTRDDPRFEAVMIYYYITESQRYVESLNTGSPPPNRRLTADPHINAADNSFFRPANYFLGFGDGGVDDGEDAGVILHEFGHVLMYDRFGYFGIFHEEKVLSEGFADYWAVSYRRHLMESDQVPEGDWRVVFPWDGVAWGGRRADGNERYSTIKQDCRSGCNFYYYAQTWSALMMNLWGLIGRENTDRLHLVAFSYLGRRYTLLDMVQALLAADKALYDGRFTDDIIDTFEPYGFIEAVVGLPQITHSPPPRLMTAPAFLELQSTITAVSLPIMTPSVHYRINSGSFMNVSAKEQTETIWEFEIPLPQSTTQIEYYIQASTSRFTQTLPKAAPEELFKVYIGKDTQSPSIKYSPITHLSPQEINQMIEIQVTDNEEVGGVKLMYTLTSSGGQSVKNGTLSLRKSNGNTYSFNITELDVSPELLVGSKLEYQIDAFDRADPPNRTLFPSDSAPPLRLDVLPTSNELGNWSPDHEAVVAQGEWMKDQNVFGYEGALWSTSPNKSYSDQPNASILSFPDVNLVGNPEAQLEFWQWYDFENIDVPGPGEPGGVIHDGGQIQVSSNGGQSWSVVSPRWGYNGNADASQSNPLAGTPVFGGSSFGWRRVRVPLPDAPPQAYRFDVSTRLVFGTGSGNLHQTTDNFAGWAVRDVRILIDPPIEKKPPEIQISPYVNQFIMPGQTSAYIDISATDDIGIESVRLDLYSVNDNQIDLLRTLRLRPSKTRSNWYEVTIPELSTTDALGYSITIRDFDNNIQNAGDAPDNLYRLHVPSESPRKALSGVRPSGAWERIDGKFSAQTDLHSGQSSLVLSPVYFATASERTMLRLNHAYNIITGSEGLISVSEDGGTTWGFLASDKDPLYMGAQDYTIIDGVNPQPTDSWFDLSDLKQPFQLRFDLFHSTTKIDGEYWEIYDAEYYRLSTDVQPIYVPTDLILYPNFPNPFINETSVSYVIPETMNVEISLFNTLGQHVQSITNRMYEAGGYTLNLNLGGLAPGVYWIRMEAGNSLLQQSITLLQ
ncbi:MAG: T9SS type A sorting domain-containing protein [Bacteroidetes bacterium]|nr:T9SS type A sorting domain-containing protein [Bacteroidota bacterium]MCY4232848.1 T9SS type A sorting domain-containing protein [Bacteroidota bacterium]